MSNLKSLSVNRIKLAKGATGFNGGQVELSNGDMLNSEVLDFFNDGNVWYVLMDVAVKFGEYDDQSKTHHIAGLVIPEGGKLQGTKLILSNDTYLSLIHSVQFKNGMCRVKARVNYDETTNTQAEITGAENTTKD
ncbi:hypothetical protein [Acinetobacter courvalinii]|uniref:hypothetical protein n=1 Tax=Acinetobacter courvalinii TaxID=280147 RepID=UPI00289A2E45|nr:hypothetical protein [Acinetobacter courvalinii]